MHRVLGGAGAVGKVGDLLGHGVHRGPRVVQGGVHQVLKVVQLVPQLVQGVLVIFQGELGLQLPGHAAHVFAAQNRPGVGAAVQIAGLAAHHAADVIAHVGIAHRAGVGAALQNAAGPPGDAADVGGGGHVLRGVQLLPVHVGQVLLRLHLGGIDAAGVPALDQAAQVPPGDAAHIVLPGDRAAEGAVDDLSSELVDAHHTAHGVAPLHAALRGALADDAGIAAGDGGHFVFPVAGPDRGLHRQVLDHGPLLHIAEQPPGVAAARDGQAGDGVALAVERPAEGGDGGKAAAAEIDVVSQHHRLSLGPAVQGTLDSQLLQVLRRGDGDGPALLVQGQSGEDLSGQQQGRQQQAQQLICRLFLHLALDRHQKGPPPVISQWSRCPPGRISPRGPRRGRWHPPRR